MNKLFKAAKQKSQDPPSKKSRLRRAIESTKNSGNEFLDLNQANLIAPDRFNSANLYLGASNRDYLQDEAFSDPLIDINELRAQRQSNFNKTVKGLGRVVNKIGVEIAKIPGYVGGAIAAPFAEDGQGMDTFVNNSWIKAIEGYEEMVNSDVLPIYTKKAVREGNIWDNISSVDFWATEGADGLAFMLSMMLPGAAISKLGMGNKLLSALGKSEKGLKFLNKIDNASKALGIEDGGKAIDLLTATTVNTLFEAGSEANGAMNSIQQKEGESDEDFQLRRAEAGRDVFLSNMGILLVPNLILNKQLLNVRNTPSKYKTLNSKIAENVPTKNTFQKIWDSKALSILGKDVPREAMEELAQSTAEEYFTGDKEQSFIETMFDVAGTTDGQKAMLLGGLFGGLGGAFGAYQESKRDKTQSNKLLDAMNSSISFHENSLTGFMKKNEDGSIKVDDDNNPVYDFGKFKDQSEAIENIEGLNQLLEQAKASGDVSSYQLIKAKLETGLITTFIKAGEDGIKVLKDKLQESEAFEQDIKEANSKLNLDITKESEINNIIERANESLRDYEFFNSYGKVLSGFKVNKENRDFYNKFQSDLSNTYIEAKSQMNIINKRLNTLNEDKASIEKDEAAAPMLKAVESEISRLEGYKETVNSLIKDILNPKTQKESFNIKLDQYKQEEEIIEKAAKQANEVSNEKESSIKKNQDAINKDQKEEADLKKNIKTAKDESNDFYNTMDELFNNYEKYNLEKDGYGMVANMYSNDHIQPIKRFVSNLTDSDAIAIEKSLNDDNNEVYDLTITRQDQDPEIIRIEKYNQVEEDSTIKTSEEDITNNDSDYNVNDNVDTNDIITDTEEKVGKPKQDVKLVNSSDSQMTSQNYSNYIQQPRSKKGEKVSFNLGYTGDNNLAKEALDLYNNIVEGGFEVSEDQIKFLVKHLPIKVNFNSKVSNNIEQQSDGVEGNAIFTHLFNEDGSGKYKLDSKEKELRTNIINKVLNDKSFNNINSKINFQYPGQIQNDIVEDKPAENNILELYNIKDVSDVIFVYTGDSNILKNPDGTDSTLAKQSKHKGSIFMIVPMANGKSFPLKLNQRRVNEIEADIILNITEKMLEFKSRVNYQDLISQKEEQLQLNEDQINYIKQEANALGIKYNNLKITDLLSSIIFEGNSKKNIFKLDGSKLIYGNNEVSSVDFSSKKEDIKQFLTTEKNRNIKVKKLLEKPYKQHVINSIVSTDVKLGGPIFQGNTDIYISSVLDNIENITSKKEDNKKIKSLSKRKGRGKQLRDIKKKNSVSNMKKDNDQNSNTIC